MAESNLRESVSAPAKFPPLAFCRMPSKTLCSAVAFSGCSVSALLKRPCKFPKRTRNIPSGVVGSVFGGDLGRGGGVGVFVVGPVFGWLGGWVVLLCGLLPVLG